jgi:hypothetical protein
MIFLFSYGFDVLEVVRQKGDADLALTVNACPLCQRVEHVTYEERST